MNNISILAQMYSRRPPIEESTVVLVAIMLFFGLLSAAFILYGSGKIKSANTLLGVVLFITGFFFCGPIGLIALGIWFLVHMHNKRKNNEQSQD